MKNLLAVLLVLSLCGCITNPPKIEYVKVPEELLVDQGPLNEILKGASLEDVAATIDANYLKYHSTREQIKQIREYQEKVVGDAVSKKNTD